MSAIIQHAELGDTVYFGFASNDTSGSGDDGATPLYDVRLAGAAASAAAVLSGTPTLLTHANFPNGAHEIAIAATTANGFATDKTYLVFASITADVQTPTFFVGMFTLGLLWTSTNVTAALAVLNRWSSVGGSTTAVSGPVDVNKASIWEDGDVTEMIRLQIDGVDLVQSGVASISRKIFDLHGDTPNTAESTTAPVVADVIFDTLQTDARWSKDSSGYNFRERIVGSNFPTGGHTYRVEYVFTGSGTPAETFPVVFEHPTKILLSS